MPTFDAGSIEAKLTLDRSQFKRELEAARAEAKRLESNGIEVNAKVDLEDKEAKTKLQKLNEELKLLHDPNVTVHMSDAEVQNKLRKLRLELAKIRSAKVGIDLDGAAKAEAEAKLVDRAVRHIPTEHRTKINMDAGNGVSGTQLLVTAILAALPLIPPLVAVAAAGIIALAAALTAAAGAAGILALGFFAVIQNYDKLQKNHKELVPQFKALKAGVDAFQKAWLGFAEAVAKPAIGLMIQGLHILEGILPRLVPLFNTFAGVLGKALDAVGAWTKSPAFAQLLTWFQTFGALQLGNILTIIGNLGQVLLNVFQAFSPLAGNMMSWLVRLTGQWVTWSQTLAQNPQFQAFVAYVKQNGPLVGAALVAIGKAIGQILVALAPLGPPLLEFVTAIGNFVANTDPGVIRNVALAIAACAAAFTLMEGAMKLVNGAMVIWNGIATLATPITWAFATALGAADVAALPLIAAIGIIILVLAALGAAFYLAYQHITPFHNAVDALWKKMGDFGKWLGGWANELISAVGSAFTGAYRVIVTFGQNIRSTLLSAWSAVKADASAAWNWLVSFIFGVGQRIRSTALSAWHGLQADASSAWNSIKSTISSVMSSISSAVSSGWNNIKSASLSSAHTTQSGVVSSFHTMQSMISSTMGSIRNVVSSQASTIANVAIAAFHRLPPGVQSAMSQALGIVQSIMGRIQGVFAGAGGWLISAGQQIMGGLISGIQTGIGQVQSLLSSVTNLIPSWKGPPERDAQLLRPNGGLIMQGLFEGIRDEIPSLRGLLSSVTGLIGNTNMTSTAGATVAGSGRMGGSPTVVLNNYYPVAEKSSVAAIRQVKELAVIGVF